MNSKRRRDLLTALMAFMSWSATLGAQAPTLRADQDVQGRKGWVLETDRIHMGLLQNGGHMAEISLISENPRLSINPMFIPTGNGYMGHMVCFPNVGPASPEERQNGIGGHGEANGVVWQQYETAADRRARHHLLLWSRSSQNAVPHRARGVAEKRYNHHPDRRVD